MVELGFEPWSFWLCTSQGPCKKQKVPSKEVTEENSVKDDIPECEQGREGYNVIFRSKWRIFSTNSRGWARDGPRPFPKWKRATSRTAQETGDIAAPSPWVFRRKSMTLTSSSFACPPDLALGTQRLARLVDLTGLLIFASPSFQVPAH